MYTKEQASKLRQELWTIFGQYMLPVPSADGRKVNWANYKTGLKNVFFKMQADKTSAYIGIEITHKDMQMQEIIYRQLYQMKIPFEEYTGEKWQWELRVPDEYSRIISRIYIQKNKINVFDKESWPDIISFLKPRIITLDLFWADAKYSFGVHL